MTKSTSAVMMLKPHFVQSVKFRLDGVLFNLEKCFGNHWGKFISIVVHLVVVSCALSNFYDKNERIKEYNAKICF